MVSGDTQDQNLLRTHLQRNRARTKWTSNVIVFQSDRSIQQIKALNFQWDLPDPDEEEVSWSFGFNTMTDRFQDVRHSMFRKVEQQRRRYGARAVELGQKGETEMTLRYRDPLADFKRIFEELLPGKRLLDPRPNDQQILYEFEGQTLDFSTLSSGEREIVVTAFDFRLRNPQDSVILFDEPELHLHPELAIRFLRVLQTIGNRNQFFLTTHSPDIISASLDDTVVFLQPPAEIDGEDRNQAVLASESEEAEEALRAIGQSLGVVALGRRIVLIEGTSASLDKETYGALLAKDSDLVLLPSGSRDKLVGFDQLHEDVISKVMWGVEFFAIRDRDLALPDDPSHRVATLTRYHLENYFLDENVWALVFAEMTPDEDPLRDPNNIREALRTEVGKTIGYAAALRVTRDARARVGPIRLMPKGVREAEIADLAETVEQRASTEAERVRSALDPDMMKAAVEAEYKRLMKAIDDDTSDWQTDVPAREALHRFIASTPLRGDLGAAKRLYIARTNEVEVDPFDEIRQIFAEFAST